MCCEMNHWKGKLFGEAQKRAERSFIIYDGFDCNLDDVNNRLTEMMLRALVHEKNDPDTRDELAGL